MFEVGDRVKVLPPDEEEVELTKGIDAPEIVLSEDGIGFVIALDDPNPGSVVVWFGEGVTVSFRPDELEIVV